MHHISGKISNVLALPWRRRVLLAACLAAAVLLALYQVRRSWLRSLRPVRIETGRVSPESKNTERATISGTQPSSAQESAGQSIVADDIPLPDGVEVAAPWMQEGEVTDLGAAKIRWQLTADEYIAFLRNRTFEQHAYRTADWSELVLVSGNEPNFFPSNPRTPMILARTRRFSKLVSQVEEAKASGELAPIMTALERTVTRLISDRRMVEEKILGLVKTEPAMFTRNASEEQWNRAGDLFQGHGLSGYDAADGAVPVNLLGTQLGLLANSFLLGLTKDARAIQSLLDIASYDGKPFLEKLPFERHPEAPDYSVAAPRTVVADAVDRILVACGQGVDVSERSAAVAKQYIEWRAERAFPEREIFESFSYDAAQTPYDLPGMVTGLDSEMSTTSLELPMKPSEAGGPGLTPEDITMILEWAERFHKAEGSDYGRERGGLGAKTRER